MIGDISDTVKNMSKDFATIEDTTLVIEVTKTLNKRVSCIDSSMNELERSLNFKQNKKQ